MLKKAKKTHLRSTSEPQATPASLPHHPQGLTKCDPSFSTLLYSKKAQKEVKSKSLFHWTHASAASDEGATDVQTLCKFLGRLFFNHPKRYFVSMYCTLCILFAW